MSKSCWHSMPAIVIGLLLTAPAAIAAPSFSCGGNLSDTEAVICSDKVLSRLDSELADAYERKLESVGGREREALRADQKDWLDRRNRCRFDKGCIRRAYVDRFDTLSSGSHADRDHSEGRRDDSGHDATTTLLRHNGSEIEMRTTRSGDVTMRYATVRAGLAAHEGSVLFSGTVSRRGKMRGTAYVFKRGCPAAGYDVLGEREDRRIVLRGASPVHASHSCKVVDYDDAARSATLEFEIERTSAAHSRAESSLPHFRPKTYYGDAREKLKDLGYSPVIPDRTRRECERENLGREDVCRRWPEVESCAGTGFARCTFLWRQGRKKVEIRTVGDQTELVDQVRCKSGCD